MNMNAATRCTLLFSVIAALATTAYPQAAAVSGLVTDRDGKPLSGAIINIDRKDIPEHRDVKTDKNGKFYYGGLANGTYRLTVMQNGLPVATADNLTVN